MPHPEGRPHPGDTRRTQTVNKQERIFSASGITPEHAANLATTLRDQVQEWGGHAAETEYDTAVYTNPSDSMFFLEHLEIPKGSKVLTVAGSGELGQNFIEKGADQVDIVDISLPGCFFNELKMVAARDLPYEDYLKLFETIEPENAVVDSEGRKSWRLFDPETYQKLRENLSEQARAYFDTIIQPGYELLQTFTDESWNSAVRPRINMGVASRPFRFRNLASFLRDQEDFDYLKKRISESEWTIKPVDILQVDPAPYDFIYLSNVGFDSSAATFKDLLRRGAKRIGATFDYRFIKDVRGLDGTEFNLDYKTPPSRQNPTTLGLHRPVNILGPRGMKVKGELIGIDRSAIHGALVEVKGKK